MTGQFENINSIKDIGRVLTDAQQAFILLDFVDFCIRADRPDLRFRLTKGAHELALDHDQRYLVETTRAHLNAHLGQARDLASLPAMISAGLTWLANRQVEDPPLPVKREISSRRRNLQQLRRQLGDSRFEQPAQTRGRRIKCAKNLRQEFKCPRPALELADLVLADHPDDTYGLVQRGASLIDLGDYDDAIQCLRQALSIEPGLIFAHSPLSKALQRRGGPEDLAESLDLALMVFEEDPSNANARRLLSIAREMGDADAIERASARILSTPSGVRGTTRHILQLDERLYEAFATGDREEAQRVLDEVHDLLRRPPHADRQVLRDLRREAALYIEYESGTDNF